MKNLTNLETVIAIDAAICQIIADCETPAPCRVVNWEYPKTGILITVECSRRSLEDFVMETHEFAFHCSFENNSVTVDTGMIVVSINGETVLVDGSSLSVI